MATLFLIAGVLTVLARPTAGADADPLRNLPEGFREVSSPRYTLYTDLPDQDVRGVILRLSHLADEYDTRTRDFSQARTDKRLPFYLFSRQADYYAAGGMKGSAGVFDQEKLMACVGQTADSRAWYTIQHEAFHQYAAMRIGRLPVWINEGLAEYFAQGIYTGDGFVCGLIPQWRLDRVRQHLADHDFLSLDDMLRYTLDEWNQRIEGTNYDQAWAYVMFLAHGDGGKYQSALVKYIRDVGHGQDPLATFRTDVGDPRAVERRFRQWVADLPDNPTLDLYGQAAVATVTSFVARAAAQRQAIGSIDELIGLVDRQELQCSAQDWLPPQTLVDVLPIAKRLGQWEFTPASRKSPAAITLTVEDQTVIRGFFTLNRGLVSNVRTEQQQITTRKNGQRGRQ